MQDVGSCSAPSAPARNDWERILDEFTSRSAPLLRSCYAIALGAGIAWISFRLGGAGLFLSAAYFIVYSAYCLANFARCREAHCIVTGLGWGVLGLVTIWAGVAGLGWLSPMWFAFLIVLALGYGFEFGRRIAVRTRGADSYAIGWRRRRLTLR